jgi:hypothetical protein
MSLKSLVSKMNILAKTNKMEVKVATSMLAVTADRIFAQGKDASNAEIGNYSAGYLKTRVRNNWPSSSKVILQATRQMVNDWTVISTNDSLGLGFKNQVNADKSGYVEDTYTKEIFKHTTDELKTLEALLDKEVKAILK